MENSDANLYDNLIERINNIKQSYQKQLFEKISNLNETNNNDELILPNKLNT